MQSSKTAADSSLAGVTASTESLPPSGVPQPAEQALLLSTSRAKPRDRRIALGVVTVSVLAFVASVPFAQVPMARLVGFVPFYQSALITNDLITAVLLFGQFKILRSRALLLLASAYLFTAGIAVIHTLSFPGLFSAAGLLGSGSQTTAWLYMVWHGGFPAAVIAYALVKDDGSDTQPVAGKGRFDVSVAVAIVLLVTCSVTLLTTSGHDLLPRIMNEHGYAPAMPVVAGGVGLLSIFAAGVVWGRRSQTVLDLWLTVSMCTLALDIGLSAVFNAGRFDLGFYAGRLYGLIATGAVLIVLLLESNRLYGVLLETSRSDRAKAAELRRLSVLDPLTRIPNRRAFEEAIDREWRRTLRYRSPLCLLMIDVDYFKRYNDRYGHVSGDQCLRAVAHVLSGFARRGGDLAARYGGEEFAIILPEMSLHEARALAERLCEEVRALDVPHEASDVAQHVTISVGLVDALAVASDGVGSEDRELPADRADPSILVEQADVALYAAKAAGRNRVTVARIRNPAATAQSQPA